MSNLPFFHGFGVNTWWIPFISSSSAISVFYSRNRYNLGRQILVHILKFPGFLRWLFSLPIGCLDVHQAIRELVMILGCRNRYPKDQKFCILSIDFHRHYLFKFSTTTIWYVNTFHHMLFAKCFFHVWCHVNAPPQKIKDMYEWLLVGWIWYHNPLRFCFFLGRWFRLFSIITHSELNLFWYCGFNCSINSIHQMIRIGFDIDLFKMIPKLGGGSKYFLFPTLPGEMIQFD